METGRTVILLNLENLYESLYDVLNQHYIWYADSRYVDLGLQTHRVRCRVDNNFKSVQQMGIFIARVFLLLIIKLLWGGRKGREEKGRERG